MESCLFVCCFLRTILKPYQWLKKYFPSYKRCSIFVACLRTLLDRVENQLIQKWLFNGVALSLGDCQLKPLMVRRLFSLFYRRRSLISFLSIPVIPANHELTDAEDGGQRFVPVAVMSTGQKKRMLALRFLSCDGERVRSQAGTSKTKLRDN